MSKKVIHLIKLQIKGGEATPAPPVGPALGGKIRKPIDFCTQFNARTKDQKGELLPVVISVYEDQTFAFIIKSPPASALILKAASITKGSPEPNRNKVASITQAQVEAIAKQKYEDLHTKNHASAARMIAGTARSMGITVTT